MSEQKYSSIRTESPEGSTWVEKRAKWVMRVMAYRGANGRGFGVNTIRIACVLSHDTWTEGCPADAVPGTYTRGHVALATAAGISVTDSNAKQRVSKEIKPLIESGFISRLQWAKGGPGFVGSGQRSVWKLCVPVDSGCSDVEHPGTEPRGSESVGSVRTGLYESDNPGLYESDNLVSSSSVPNSIPISVPDTSRDEGVTVTVDAHEDFSGEGYDDYLLSVVQLPDVPESPYWRAHDCP